VTGESSFLGRKANCKINRWGSPKITCESLFLRLEGLSKIKCFVVRGQRVGSSSYIIFAFPGHRRDGAGIKIDKPKAVSPFTPIIIILDMEFSSRDNWDKSIAISISAS
jgi:hypothetical protein